DCLARRPDGSLLRRKVLSSAVTKGLAAVGSTVSAIIDPARQETDGFWRRYGLQLLDSQGRIIAVSTVTDSESGRIVIKPLTQRPGKPALTAEQISGCAYELISPEEAPLLAIRLFLGLRLDEPI